MAPANKKEMSIAALKREVQDLRQQVLDLNKEVLNARAISSSLKLEVNDLTADNTICKSRLKEAEDKLQREYKKCQNLEDRIATLKRSIHILTAP